VVALVALGLVGAQEADRKVHVLDIGTADDAQFIVAGIHGPEGPNEKSQTAFYRECTMRWFGNEWTMVWPFWARRENLVTLRAQLARGMKLSVGDGWQVELRGVGDERYEYSFVLPAEAVGDEELLEVRGTADPPFVAGEGDRDKRGRAMAVDWVHVEPLDARPAGVPVAQREGPAPERGPEHFINLGLEGDERAVGEGIYQREGPWGWSKDPMGRWVSFRWFSSHWTLTVPVFPGRHNEVRLRAKAGRSERVTVSDGLQAFLFPSADPRNEYRIYVPAEVVKDRDRIELRGEAVPPYKPAEDARDKRELVMMADWVRVRPLDKLPEGAMEAQTMPETKEPDLALPYRLRGTEARPLFTDVEAYVTEARLTRCNVMTIGPMNGQHFTAFPTRYGTPAGNMQPDFLSRQIEALHEQGIAAIGWLPFNVQDLRSADQCQAAAKHPEWRMEFMPWDERSSEGKVGMCVVSSPWREMHAEILKEAAAHDLDGVFFDGFYLGGIPHPSSPGCVCRWCREAFKKETGLETPAKVDWADPTFKRWVRWRNHKLLEVARFFRDKMREVNPDLYVTCNWNLWPFGNKDWDTAIPMWSVDDLGTSQHAYTGRADQEWVMLGFKSRVSHDLSPNHSDIWRTAAPAWNYDGSQADQERHELTMRTFMLSGLSYGTTPWHGGHIRPGDIGIRVHEAVRARERFFSQDEVRYLGVVLSQNTHDFYGHLPGTTNLAAYQDTILGAWLLLTEEHVPFRFVFDNQVEAGALGDYKVLLLPNAACLSDAMVEQLRRFAAGGGRVIATGETGDYDEWGDRRGGNALQGSQGPVRLEGTPVLDWLRNRDARGAEAVLRAVREAPLPIEVEAPRSLAVNATWAPDRKALWLHLLNVSAFYPLGDTGFRGLGAEPVYAGEVASDASILQGGKVKRVNVPATGIIVRVPGFQVRSARLGVAGETITPDGQGRYAVPGIAVHDVLVLELE